MYVFSAGTMSKNILETVGILFCVIQNKIIAKNTTNMGNEKWKNETITERNLVNDYLPSSSEYLTSSENYPNGATEMNFLWNNNFSTDVPFTVNQFEEVGEFGSVQLNLSLEDCFNRWQSYQIRGSKGNIRMSFTPSANSQADSYFLICSIELNFAPGMSVYVQTKRISPVISHYMMQFKLLDEDNNIMVDGYFWHLPEEFVTYSNILRIKLEMHTIEDAFELHLTFMTIPQTSRSHLNVNFTSPNTGKYFE